MKSARLKSSAALLALAAALIVMGRRAEAQQSPCPPGLVFAGFAEYRNPSTGQLISAPRCLHIGDPSGSLYLGLYRNPAEAYAAAARASRLTDKEAVVTAIPSSEPGGETRYNVILNGFASTREVRDAAAYLRAEGFKGAWVEHDGILDWRNRENAPDLDVIPRSPGAPIGPPPDFEIPLLPRGEMRWRLDPATPDVAPGILINPGSGPGGLLAPGRPLWLAPGARGEAIDGGGLETNGGGGF